jgi:hypothetical protein
MEADHLRRRIEEGDPFWPAQLAVGIAIALNLPLSGKLTIGPNWLLPVVEGALLIALVTSLPSRGNRPHAGHRWFALSVVGLVTLVNIVSIGLLVHYLLGHHAHVQGRPLIASGAVLLATNILLFAVWFWEFDRGGPVSRFMNPDVLPDFQFPQMENPQLAPKATRVPRLPLHVAHKRDRLQPDRHDAAHPEREDPHVAAVGDVADHDRAGRRPRGEHPQLVAAARGLDGHEHARRHPGSARCCAYNGRSRGCSSVG